MIAFLKGLLCSINNDSIVVDVNGVGYQILVPGSLFSKLPPLGNEIHIYTHMVLKEDGASLYGFDDVDYLNSFKMLLNVNGVGPKGALSILSVTTSEGLALAVSDENVGLLSRASGIGRKTAQRIILELKGKLDSGPLKHLQAATPPSLSNDAYEALISLGFESFQASLSVKNAIADLGEKAQLTEVVRHALKTLANR